MSDDFQGYSASLSGPATRAAVVTPNDSSDLASIARGLYVGGAGDLSIVTSDGDTVTLTGVQAGTVLPVRVARVRATGTTATAIVAFS
jgi:hypothetical protein